MPVEESSDFPVVDHDVFDEIKEMLEDEFVDMIDEYKEDADVKLRHLFSAAREMQLNVLNEIAHAFASSSAHLGFMRLHTLLRSVETKAKDREQANYVELVESIQESYQDVLRKLDS